MTDHEILKAPMRVTAGENTDLVCVEVLNAMYSFTLAELIMCAARRHANRGRQLS